MPKTLVRSRGPSPRIVGSATPSAYSVRWLLITPTVNGDLEATALAVIVPSTYSVEDSDAHHASASCCSTPSRSC